MGWIRDAAELGGRMLTLTRDLEKTRSNLEKLEQKFFDLTLIVQRLTDQVEMNRKAEEAARRRHQLELKVQMLEFEKRLGPGRSGDER